LSGIWELDEAVNRKQRRAQGLEQRQKLHKAGHSAPGDPVALHEAGIEAYRAGRLAAAADLIGQAIAASGPVPEFHYNLAIVLKAMGRLADAAASYERAIALKPDHVNAHNNLGNVWKALGRPEKARASFAQALTVNPDNADTHYSLGILCGELGERDQAGQHLRRCLVSDPRDSRGAGILLAHLGVGDAPERTPEAQLLSLYDVRSRFWDQEVSYFAPQLVADGLHRHAPATGLDILDIGCGTGLAGALVRDLAGRLDGVDLSPAMLEKAKAKAVYDTLFQADLAPFMAGHTGSYDAVLAAATLIHFGDLKALFQAVALCLRAEGLFVFTLFPHEPDTGTDYAVAASTRLAQSGCFRHSIPYLGRLAAETGFAVLELEKIVHEHDQDDQPVAGLLAVLKR
jgi:predicted TPR repeat methyltransferase